MTTSSLLKAIYSWSAERKPLVLATVYETAGSTYSKAGAQMLMTGDSRFQAMLAVASKVISQIVPVPLRSLAGYRRSPMICVTMTTSCGVWEWAAMG